MGGPRAGKPCQIQRQGVGSCGGAERAGDEAYSQAHRHLRDPSFTPPEQKGNVVRVLESWPTLGTGEASAIAVVDRAGRGSVA